MENSGLPGLVVLAVIARPSRLGFEQLPVLSRVLKATVPVSQVLPQSALGGSRRDPFAVQDSVTTTRGSGSRVLGSGQGSGYDQEEVAFFERRSWLPAYCVNFERDT